MRLPRSLVAVPLVLVLAGCNPPVPEPTKTPDAPSPTISATPSPTADATPPESPYAPDVLFVVTATATADNGSVMDLMLQVHRPQSWDQPGTSQAAAMIEACGGGLDEGLLAANLWSFATVDVDTVERDGPTWPAGRRLFVVPYATYLNLATSGFPADDDEVAAETPSCRRDKVIDGQGAGGFVVGFAGDNADAGAAGNFTKWANHNYGFVGVRVAGQSAASAGIVLSDCTAVVTDAGRELNGDADWWSSRVDESHCVFGSLQEDRDY